MVGVAELLYLGLLLFGLGYMAVLALSGQAGDHAALHPDGAHGPFDLSPDASHGLAHPHDAAHDVSVFTPTVIASALAGVGGVGLFATLTLGLPWLLHGPLAALGGGLVGWLALQLYSRFIHPSQGSSEVRVGDLWGTEAEVITPIPANRLGEIRFVARGAYHSAAARSATGETIPRGQTVMIETMEDAVAVVRPAR